MTRLFDAHCDTILRVVDDGAELGRHLDEGHVDVPRLLAGGVGCQLFACFATRSQHGDGVAARVERLLDAVDGLAALPGVVIPRTLAELDAAASRPDRVAILPALEGGDALDGRVERLDALKARGVRYITIAWDDNELGGSSFGAGGGMTPLGREVVRAMEQRRILVDASHLSDASFFDLADTAERPFVASHSSCRALSDHARNLTDEQIRVIAERGGVIGVMFEPAVLSERYRVEGLPIARPYIDRMRADPTCIKETLAEVTAALAHLPKPGIDAVLDHVEHLAEVGGIDCAAFGSDFDGIASLPVGLEDCEGYSSVPDALRARGFSEADVEAVCWGNWRRAFAVTFDDRG